MKLRVLSYNIHKGFTGDSRRLVLSRIRESIRRTHADLVFLQEVVGEHRFHAARHQDWPNAAQFEFLADEVWSHFAYGKNAVYAEGHHGNAILSRYPIEHWENIDVSNHRLERRGLLHATIQIPREGQKALKVHAICLHLDLLEMGRKRQLIRLCERIAGEVPSHEPLVVAGDFNDWTGYAGRHLAAHASLQEVFTMLHGKPARTFPSFLPLLRLDRIYYRGLHPVAATRLAGGNWKGLSDHAAVLADLEISGC